MAAHPARRSRNLGRMVGSIIAVSLLAWSWSVRAQNEPSPSGPKTDAGETVLAPKKTQPQPAKNAPERINPNEVFTLSTATNLVNVDVLVVDKNGYPIPNLGKTNFRVLDDGVQQTITNFSTGEAPVTVAMLIEFSSKWWAFLYVALQNSYQFLNHIQPKDWVAVVEFDMRTHILTDFTQDRSEVRSALDQLRFPGFAEVNLYDAVAEMLDKMKDVEGRKAILLIGSGCDTFSKLTLDQALRIVKESDTVIYPISTFEFLTVRFGDYVPCGPGTGGFGMSLNGPQARNVFQTLAKYTGGQAYFPRFSTELPSIYEQIGSQMRRQYSLGFAPSNPSKDGKFHKLKVEVLDEQGGPLRVVDEKGKPVKYRILSREGYYAPKS